MIKYLIFNLYYSASVEIYRANFTLKCRCNSPKLANTK